MAQLQQFADGLDQACRAWRRAQQSQLCEMCELQQQLGLVYLRGCQVQLCEGWQGGQLVQLWNAGAPAVQPKAQHVDSAGICSAERG